MIEAADTTPSHAWDNPRRTVLSHFFDLAADARYFAVIHEWSERGWVPDAMTCAIHRARHRAIAKTDPLEASRVAAICIERARRAAVDAERAWELDACLDDASFLTETSTIVLEPHLRVAADPTEPRILRERMLFGMTHVFLRDSWTRRANDPELSLDEARRRARTEFEIMSGRHDAIVQAVSPTMDVALLAAGTAIGALEIERVAMEFGSSLVARRASSPEPASRDLAWAWVRLAKATKEIPRLASLGIWRRSIEPPGDVHWYMCVEDVVSKANEHAAHPAPSRIVRALALRSGVALEPRHARAICSREAAFEVRNVVGPQPLAATLRLAATSSLSRAR